MDTTGLYCNVSYFSNPHPRKLGYLQVRSSHCSNKRKFEDASDFRIYLYIIHTQKKVWCSLVRSTGLFSICRVLCVGFQTSSFKSGRTQNNPKWRVWNNSVHPRVRLIHLIISSCLILRFI